MALLVISILFGLSLLAAWILFKVLQSTAAVKRSDYQLGGAVAGFVVILSLLSVTYMQVDNRRHSDQLARLTADLVEAKNRAAEGRQCLVDDQKEIVFSGTVSPSVDGANVVLGISAVQLQSDGKFAIKVRHVKPTDLPSIYVIGAASHAPYAQVLEHDDPQHLRIAGGGQ